MPKIVLQCMTCGVLFERWPSFLRTATARGSTIRYCSNACSWKARSEGAYVCKPRKGRTLDCEFCRAPFYVCPSHKPRRFCSETCRQAAYKAGVPRADRVRGDYPINQPPNRFSWRHRRDWLGTQCAHCGSTDRLQMDHIIPIIAGGKAVRENAQTLCFSCNTKKRMQSDIPLARQQNLLRRP